MKIGYILVLILLANVKCVDDDFASNTYNALSRVEKFNKIWAKVNEDHTPWGWFSAASLLRIFLEGMNPTFDHYSDKIPEGRNKYIHTVGVVGLVEFESDKSNNPYSGVFKGCSHVVLRLSCAKEPNAKKATASGASDNFTPGFGIKFLRDGLPSGNTVAMFGVNGQNSWNFFKNDFANHIPDAEGVALKLLEKKFSEATDYTGKMGLKDMAQFDQFGNNDSSSLNFPYKLVFRPNPELQRKYSDYYSESFLEQLEALPKDIIIYDVLAAASPTSDFVKIGALRVKEQFVRSAWGDQYLFFRHHRMEEDFSFHPEWKNAQLLESPEFQASFKAKYGFAHP